MNTNVLKIKVFRVPFSKVHGSSGFLASVLNKYSPWKRKMERITIWKADYPITFLHMTGVMIVSSLG